MEENIFEIEESVSIRRRNTYIKSVAISLFHVVYRY